MPRGDKDKYTHGEQGRGRRQQVRFWPRRAGHACFIEPRWTHRPAASDARRPFACSEEGRCYSQAAGAQKGGITMIRKLKSGEYRLYSRKKDANGRRKNLGTFKSRVAAEKHEREVQFFKRH
jgi:hypothetical protein